MPVLSGLFALHKRGLHECLRLEATGLSYDLFYPLGTAGAGRAEESARATAEPYSQLAPNRIMVHPCAWLPDQREELVSYLDEVLHDADEDALRARRAKMSSI